MLVGDQLNSSSTRKNTNLTSADANMGNPAPNQERKKELAAIAEFAYMG